MEPLVKPQPTQKTAKLLAKPRKEAQRPSLLWAWLLLRESRLDCVVASQTSSSMWRTPLQSVALERQQRLHRFVEVPLPVEKPEQFVSQKRIPRLRPLEEQIARVHRLPDLVQRSRTKRESRLVASWKSLSRVPERFQRPRCVLTPPL